MTILSYFYFYKNIKSNTANLECIHCSNHCHIGCIKDKEHNMTGNCICDQCIGKWLPFNCMIHNDEFINVIIDYQQIPSKFILEKLNELLFDPFEINDYISNFNQYCQYLRNDITNLNCKYYDVHKFVTNGNVPKSFSLMHIHIRSVPKHFHTFTPFLYCLNYYFTVIGLSETWFTSDNVDCYKQLGYNIINHVRTDKAEDGASLIIPYTVRSDLTVFGTNIEIEGILSNYDTNWYYWKCLQTSCS